MNLSSLSWSVHQALRYYSIINDAVEVERQMKKAMPSSEGTSPPYW
ncbi:MAG: hypothetical protein ACR5LD_00040 [Symbiopectobacterium sp.]